MADLSFRPRAKEERPRPAVPVARLAWAGALGLALGLVVWYVVARGLAYWELRSEVAALEAEYQQVRSSLDLQQRAAGLEQRRQQLERIVRPFREAPAAREALHFLNLAVPGGVVLDAFSLSATGQVRITGTAPNLAEVARFLVALEATGRYQQVQVRFPTPFQTGAPAPAPGAPSGAAAPGGGPAQATGPSAAGRSAGGGGTPGVRFEVLAVYRQAGQGMGR